MNLLIHILNFQLGGKYVIKILESEEQVIDIFKPYYQENLNKDNQPIVIKSKKSRSHIFKPEEFTKMGSLEKIFTEGIKRNSKFEDILNDPRIINLYDSLN